MENQAMVRSITLKDLWNVLIQRLWIIILAAVVAAGGIFIGGKLLVVPEYESTATLYILRQDGETSSSDISSDFSLALKVVNDCSYMLKSHSVLDALIDDLDLNMDYKTLHDAISTSNPDDTRILEVTVTHTSAQEAKRIVDGLVEIGTVKINEAMGFEQVNLYEHGTLSEEPCNDVGLLICLLAGMIAAMLTYCIFLILFIVDDSIQNEEDIERILGLSILGNIPSAGDTEGRKMYGANGKKMYGVGPTKNQPRKQTSRGKE